MADLPTSGHIIMPLLALLVAGCSGTDAVTIANTSTDGALDARTEPPPVHANDASTSDATGPGAGDGSGHRGGDGATDASRCGYAFTGTLAAYEFTGAPGNQVSTPAATTAPGLSATAIGRSSELKPELGSGSINSSRWSTGALDPSRYYTLTVSPPPDCSLSITGVMFDTETSTSGPTEVAVGNSADAFAVVSPSVTGTVATPTVSVSGTTTPVELRLFGYEAGSAGGTMRVDALTVTGSLE